MKEKGIIALALLASVMLITGAVMMTMGCSIIPRHDPEPETVQVAENPEPAEEQKELQLLYRCHLCYADKPSTHTIHVDGMHFTDICDECLDKFKMVVDHDVL